MFIVEVTYSAFDKLASFADIEVIFFCFYPKQGDTDTRM